MTATVGVSARVPTGCAKLAWCRRWQMGRPWANSKRMVMNDWRLPALWLGVMGCAGLASGCEQGVAPPLNGSSNPASSSVVTSSPSLPVRQEPITSSTDSSKTSDESAATGEVPLPIQPDASSGVERQVPPHVVPVRIENWPAGGRELTLRVVPEQKLPTLLTGDLELTNVDGEAVPFELAAVKLETGYTGILLRAAADGERTLIADAAERFIESRPASERIAVFEWREQVRQMVGFTTERARLGAALHTFEAEPVAQTFAAANLATRIVAEQSAIVGGSAPRVMRSAVVLRVAHPAPSEGASDDAATRTQAAHAELDAGRSLEPAEPSDGSAPRNAAPDAGARLTDEPERDAGNASLLDGVELAESTVLLEYPELAPTDVEGSWRAISAASEHIDQVTQSGHLRLSLCSSVDKQSLELRSEATLLGALVVPETLPEQRSGACDPEQIGPGLRRYPDRVAMSFTEAERAEYDARVEAHDDSEFTLSLQFDAEQLPVPAKAKLHGQTSLSCERKSYTVNLEGPLERPLLPNSAINEFYLISMCLDSFYVHQVTAETLLAQLGLFALEGNLVEVTLDGETRGVYLLLEKTREELTRDNSEVTVVLRRDNGPDDNTVWEAKGTDAPEDAVANVTAFMTAVQDASEETRAATFERQMNLHTYLTWLAANSALENGDYVDELWLFGTAMVNDAGHSDTWYSLESWDPDDTFVECHTGDRVAWPDPHGLAYCAEAELDAALLSTPTIYADFVDILESLLDGALSQDNFDAAAAQTRERLLPLLQTSATVAVMEQFETDDPIAATALVDAEIAHMSQAFAERRDTLLGRIATYRTMVTSVEPAATELP